MARKIINSDIYGLAKLVDDVKKEFIPEETSETLAVGTYGYIGAIESKRLQTQVIMSQELCNESFASRARLERNVITHAITSNIEDINAVPAKMDVILAIRQRDIDDLMKNNKFIIDRECPIYVGNFEFHLEYDIVLQRITIAGNENTYTAQYDMSRENPSSTITNPYISAPAIIMLNSEYYIFINVILSQVEHNRNYSKLVSSNVIDNKTVNFTFNDQLSYFEIHVIESSEDFYITPVFEGSGVPDNVSYYCWYQYIDVDKIRVRFDRNSYMPGLNAEIEILYKTTKGTEGNFPYKDDIVATFESEMYGYKNLNIMITPVSDSDNGKNRKSKKELQKLIPKEKLARGALTTINDLNNYFGMIDSDYGRIVVQKKIDNQQERIYYAYVVLKDVNGDIVPSNTIDLKIPMDQLIETTIAESKSPRYVLRPGTKIRLSDDKTTGEIVSGPIKNIGLNWATPIIDKNKAVSIIFKIQITSDEYPEISCRALVNGKSSVYIDSPTFNDSCIYTDKYTQPVDAVNEMMISAGELIKFNYQIVPSATGVVTFVDELHKGFTLSDKDGVTLVNESSGESVPCTVIISDDNIITITSELTKDITYSLSYIVMANTHCEEIMTTKAKYTCIDNKEVSMALIRFHAIVLTVDENPESLLFGNIFTYHVSFVTNETSIPKIDVELSRGVGYVPKSSSTTIDGNTTIYDPSVTDLLGDAGFLYTNPYSIVINHYHLYSAFYMMTVNTSPYLYFEYINQKSAAQFISTNIYWRRTFLGQYKNIYAIRMSLTQSIAKDLGLIIKDEDDHIIGCKVKLIILFYRDGTPYRYKNMILESVDDTTFTFNFYAELDALDLFDQDNNIKVGSVGLLNQMEEEYGFFNANTEAHVYALCEQSDTDGKYTRYDLDAYVPGLEGWTVTNVYKVSTGFDFFYNYAEIMGSRVIPYGKTVTDNESGTEILVPDGYYVKSVPVFGYDYSVDETLINNAIDALNYDKLYIDDAMNKCENSFGIDFKCFNTYGPSKTFYIIRDKDNNGILDDTIEYIDRVNISIYFRMRLLSRNDNYTKDLIIKDIKDYMEDLNDMGEIHIPNLVTQITTDYKESIGYFEFLGFNNYGPGIQHLYKLSDKQIPIHVCPEFININNVRSSTDSYDQLSPDITIYLSEN